MADSPEATETSKPGMKKNVALLAMCQALFNSSTGVVLSVSALVGLALASNKSLATLPQALQWEATAAFSIPLAMIMRRFGRRTGFIFGALMGSLGAIIAAAAIFRGSFELYLVAIIFFGAYTISGQTYRFAAADVADEKWHGIAISLVIGGGVFAAFVGPEISKWTHDVSSLWLGNETFAKAIEFICGPGIAAAATVPGQNPPYQFGGTFIVLAFLPILLIFMVSLVGFPKKEEQKFENSGRPLGDVIGSDAARHGQGIWPHLCGHSLYCAMAHVWHVRTFLLYRVVDQKMRFAQRPAGRVGVVEYGSVDRDVGRHDPAFLVCQYLRRLWLELPVCRGDTSSDQNVSPGRKGESPGHE